jgi:two-component system chemotaxis response regulator CheY
MGRILTVDDSASQRKRLAATLAEAGHVIIQARDGLEGLAFAEGGLVDLVISDVIMPGMDGLTLVRRLRALPAYRMVPILILTTESDLARKHDAKSAGADGWILKPFDPEQLVAAIGRVIGWK